MGALAETPTVAAKAYVGGMGVRRKNRASEVEQHRMHAVLKAREALLH